MEKPSDAPACFAAASVFAHESAMCKRCCAYDACTDASYETLQAVQTRVDVRDLLRKHQAARAIMGKLPEPNEPTLAPKAETDEAQKRPFKPRLPTIERKTRVAYQAEAFTDHEQELLSQSRNKHTKALAKLLWSVGLTATLIYTELRKGTNPCDDAAPRYFSVLCDLLIRGEVTRPLLREELEKRGAKSGGGQSPSTAASHASFLFEFVKLFGIAQEKSGALVLSPIPG